MSSKRENTNEECFNSCDAKPSPPKKSNRGGATVAWTAKENLVLYQAVIASIDLSKVNWDAVNEKVEAVCGIERSKNAINSHWKTKLNPKIESFIDPSSGGTGSKNQSASGSKSK